MMPALTGAAFYFIIGLIILEICLRFDADGKKTLSDLSDTHPIAYVFVMAFGVICWPLVVYDTLRRARRRRRASRERHNQAALRSVPAPGIVVGNAEPVRLVCGKCGMKTVSFFVSPEEGPGKECAKCGHIERVQDLPAAYAKAELADLQNKMESMKCDQPPQEPIGFICNECGETNLFPSLPPPEGGLKCAKCGHIERDRYVAPAYPEIEDHPDVDLSPGEFLCAIPCPRCQGPAKLCKPDERTRGWYRVTCAEGHFGDLRTDSILIPEEHRLPWKEGA